MKPQVTVNEIARFLRALRMLDDRAIETIATELERALRQSSETRPSLSLIKGGKAT